MILIILGYNNSQGLNICAAATQNLLLEAQFLGIGAVWLGIYPRDERVKVVKELPGLPGRVVPMAVISIDYPAENKGTAERYDKTRVHINKWDS